MTSTRVFFIGGLMSYRALFGWLSPWVFIPSLLVAPVFQILNDASGMWNQGLSGLRKGDVPSDPIKKSYADLIFKCGDPFADCRMRQM